jgi:integrase
MFKGSELKVKKIQMVSGDRYAVLIGDIGNPLLYPNLFVTLNHRNQSHASNTCFAVFEHLKYLYEILSFLDIDIIQRCKEGIFLSKSEAEYLSKWANCTVNTFREHVTKQKSKNIVSFKPSLKKLETARAVIVMNKGENISSSTAFNRLTTFAEFIGWLEKELSPPINSTAEKLLKDLRPNKFDDKEGTDDEYTSLTSNQIIRVLDVIRPDSSENPWVNESLRYRNQLIINMLEAIGCRRGELLKIKCEDIKSSSNTGRRYVKIRSKVDLSDNRLDRPEAKTLGRIVPLDKRLSNMYDNYLIHHRSNANGAELIQYLFTTHNHRVSNNNALSLSALNKLCREISKVVGFRVHPHSLRHAWNDKFSKLADKRIAAGKTSEAKSESDRQKLMGWSEDSKMAKRYSRRHDDKRAFEIGLELQEEESANIESIVGSYDEDIEY